jgi:uncharacterized repeat protein (TIGR03803 family)
LILSGNTLYGTTVAGGIYGNGTVFSINTDGTRFTNLYSFTGSYDGGTPHGGLILLGNTLYGTAQNGGLGWGTVFAINTDGTGFTNFYNFTEASGPNNGLQINNDGANPQAGLILSSNILYSTAHLGGSSGYGTVFSLSFAPQLVIFPSEAELILTWPTNVAGFDYTGYTLQSSTSLVSSAVWSTVSPKPTAVNGQNAVTNQISGTQKFYRLRL